MTHPNAQVYWPDIGCQRGHASHASKRVLVDLSVPHGYADLCPVPKRLAPKPFVMNIWDPETHPVDGGPYCPAHDAVSETIVSHRTWEPRETVLALTVMRSAPAGSVCVDMGAQLGWFSLLAASLGLPVDAWEADPANAELLLSSAQVNGWGHLISVIGERIGPDTPVQPVEPRIRWAKLDLEGAEPDAVRVLWPAIEAGQVDFMQVEVSPVFHDGYPELVTRIVDAGYRAYVLPAKQNPPHPLTDPGRDMERWRIDNRPPGALAELVASFHQEDMVFQREGAAW